ncbi:unnamed protein product [Aureobasidium mustum]|uniref:Uncharacterized protein n=1 Tax=Aureobasidium mustum TaxID=2773714 RepID=A0A9N8JT52_9PEZI|nr:unnamed protein product [Aureobasidium mustum]
MSADQTQQQFSEPDNNTQAAVLVPAAMTLALSLVLYGIRIRARRSSPFVWTDGMVAAALVSVVDCFSLQ